MSPRSKRLRKMLNPPPIKGFKPYGPDVKISNDPIYLYYEEYEALRLCDYDLLNHHQACVIMGVSRPTFTRIYASLRQKIAAAFAEARPIHIEGGKVYFDSDWFHCDGCGCFFSNPDKENDIHSCPLCHSTKVNAYTTEDIELSRVSSSQHDICVCPNCGFEKPHQLGKPCSKEACPKCNVILRRKRKLKYR